MTAQYDKDTILDTALQIIKDEHEVFLNHEFDNDDYIPRIARVAESAGSLLARNGMAKREVRANVERIIEFGRRLFVQEWMRPMMGETEPPREEDAIEEFERCLKKERKARKQRVPTGATLNG